MKTRPVYVRLQGSSFMVRYADRSYGQRHLAAQFFAPDTTLERVEAWVRSQPRLTLVPDPDGTGRNCPYPAVGE